jgi:hypothetical protein
MRAATRFLLAILPIAAGAQVVELQGGGSSYFNGYGLNANIWGRGFDGWLGAGYQEGWRFGGFARLQAGRDTVRFGNDLFVHRYPTDVFGSGLNTLVQGATIQGARKGFRYSAFAGASATGVGVPLFSARRADKPFGAIVVSDSVTPALTLFASTVFTSQQSIVGGAHWGDVAHRSVAIVGGVGANRPFGAASGTLVTTMLQARASYLRAAPGYRRVDLPVPAQSRLDGPAVEVTLRPRDWISIMASRMTFTRDSAEAGELDRATGSSLVVSARGKGSHASVGTYLSERTDARDLSAFFAAGRAFTSWIGADAYLLGTIPDGGERRLTPVLMLHERASVRLALDQVATFNAGQTSLAFGGTWFGSLADIGVGYQIVHTPFDRANPFVRALSVTLRINLGDYRANVGTTILPTGDIRYDATAAKFLYLGGDNGLEPGVVRARFDSYLVRGSVVDEAGDPVAGAAVEVDGTLAFTDSQGRFFIRAGRRRAVPFRVVTEEFLGRGRFEVVSAPETVTPEIDERARAVRVVVRLVRPAGDGASR